MQDFDQLWDYSNPEETAIQFRAILDKTDTENNETYVAQLYTQLARTQSSQAKWDAAHEYLNQAKLLLHKADAVSEVRYLLELGRTYNSSGDRKQAYELFVRVWNLARDIQADGYAVDAAHMIAITVDSAQDTMAWNLKALEYAEESSQPAAQKWKASLNNNIGWTYFDDGDHQTTLDMFEKALIEREQQGRAENTWIAKWCVARVQRELGQVETALKTQLGLLAEHEANNSEDEYVYEELANCYAALEDKSNAAKYAKLAYDMLSKVDWFVESEGYRLQALRDMM